MKGTSAPSRSVLTPIDAADLIVAVILGNASASEAATRLGVCPGKVLGLCEPVKAELTDTGRGPRGGGHRLEGSTSPISRTIPRRLC